jgi:hypothetical protein
VPAVPIAAAFGLAWIAEVVIVCGTCGALAVAASIALFAAELGQEGVPVRNQRKKSFLPAPELRDDATLRARVEAEIEARQARVREAQRLAQE